MIPGEAIEAMIEVLSEHQDMPTENGGRSCICGDWEGPWTGSAFASHQAAAIKDTLRSPDEAVEATVTPSALLWLQALADDAARHIEGLPEGSQPFWFRTQCKATK